VKAPDMRKGQLVLGCTILALAVVAAAPGSARAAEDDVPHLWEPDQAVAFLLGTPPVARAGDADGARTAAVPWDGALGGGVTRALFGSYQVVLSSQDLPVCAFSPSCSRFAERVIGRCGLAQGALLSLDRLLRDHPLALAFYPRAPEGHLLKDDPERYCLTASE
jgi:putative component of membrane protein insertase Oxa1/YidC/SpoIIIJ protein YidD